MGEGALGLVCFAEIGCAPAVVSFISGDPLLAVAPELTLRIFGHDGGSGLARVCWPFCAWACAFSAAFCACFGCGYSASSCVEGKGQRRNFSRRACSARSSMELGLSCCSIHLLSPCCLIMLDFAGTRPRTRGDSARAQWLRRRSSR